MIIDRYAGNSPVLFALCFQNTRQSRLIVSGHGLHLARYLHVCIHLIFEVSQGDELIDIQSDDQAALMCAGKLARCMPRNKAPTNGVIAR